MKPNPPHGSASPSGESASRSIPDRYPPVKPAADLEPVAKPMTCEDLLDEDLKTLYKSLSTDFDGDDQKLMWNMRICELYEKCGGDEIRARYLMKQEMRDHLSSIRRHRNEYWAIPIALFTIALSIIGLTIACISIGG